MQNVNKHATVSKYIKKMKSNYETKIGELQTQHEQQINNLKKEAADYEVKYLHVKEKHELLLYKRFARSAEQIPYDDN